MKVRLCELGVLPAVPLALGVGAAMESAYAWYDPDFFLAIWPGMDEEKQIAALNNAWHQLWRSGSATGVGEKEFAMAKLDAAMGQWWTWKQEYNAAILQRWVPFTGRDWSYELSQWKQRFEENLDRVAKAGGKATQDNLEKRGVDPRFLVVKEPGLIDQTSDLVKGSGAAIQAAAEQAGLGLGKGTKSALFWPAVALGGAVVVLLFLSSPPARRT